MPVWTDLCAYALETMLCKFEWILALIQLHSILCKFEHFFKYEQFCVIKNALMQLETILCEFGQICVTGNADEKVGNYFCDWLLAGNQF